MRPGFQSLVQVRVEPDLRAALEARALSSGQTISDLTRAALRAAVEIHCPGHDERYSGVPTTARALAVKQRG